MLFSKLIESGVRNPMAKSMQFNPEFDKIVLKAILTQIHTISDSINEHIQHEAPVDTGTLRESSYAEVDEDNATIEVGVDPNLVNPETNQRVGDYASYVINGTSRQDANAYLERSVEAALQEQWARGRG